MGAMVGAMYVTGKLQECKEWLCSWNRRKLWQLADFTLGRDGMVKGDRFIREFKQIIPDVRIEDLPLPYIAMATDIVHDCEVVFDKGSMLDAVRASISIPMVFRPFRKEGRVLVDGGILNPLPLTHAIRTEGDLLVAVDVNAPIDSGKMKRMSPYQLLTKSSRLMQQQITRYQIEQNHPDMLIQMSGNDYDMMKFYRAAELVESGREAARKAVEKYQH